MNLAPYISETVMNAVPYTEEITEQEQTDMSTINKVTSIKALSEFALNPFNVRELSHITIEPLMTEVTNPETQEKSWVYNVDEQGKYKGFALDRNAIVTEDYRAKFNQFLESLVKVEDGKIIYRATMPFKTTRKLPRFDNPVDGETVRTVVEGNTRLHILNKLVELSPDNLDFEFSYFIDSKFDETNAIAYLLAAPDAGNNASVPILGDANTQAERAFKYAMSQQPPELTKEQAIKEALKLVQTVMKLAGRSNAFFTYFKTVKTHEDKYLDNASKSCLAIGEIQYRYVKHWLKITEELPEGVTLDELMEKADFKAYLNHLSYRDYSNFPRITTRAKLNYYFDWCDAQLKPEPEETEESNESGESDESNGEGNTEGEGDSNKSTGVSAPPDYTYTRDDLLSLSNSLHFVAECFVSPDSDPEVLTARTPHVIKIVKSAVELLINANMTNDLLEFIASKLESVDCETFGESLKKLTKGTDAITKALSSTPAE